MELLVKRVKITSTGLTTVTTAFTTAMATFITAIDIFSQLEKEFGAEFG